MDQKEGIPQSLVVSVETGQRGSPEIRIPLGEWGWLTSFSRGGEFQNHFPSPFSPKQGGWLVGHEKVGWLVVFSPRTRTVPPQKVERKKQRFDLAYPGPQGPMAVYPQQ
jgi:hypothetical protein